MAVAEASPARVSSSLAQGELRGVTFAELADRVPQHTAWALRHVLAGEIAAGRVVRVSAGGYALRPGAFTPAVVKALRQLPELDDD